VKQLTKIILVRHGETFWNLSMRFQGHSNIELTETGLRQAELVADRLTKGKIHAVYASDLRRAFDTAKSIADKQNLQVVIIPEFREINFGEWEGQRCGKYAVKSEAIHNFYTSPDKAVIPGGETFAE
jgi:alpha-ribazole phosphatase